jgi:hypothetical protein
MEQHKTTGWQFSLAFIGALLAALPVAAQPERTQSSAYQIPFTASRPDIDGCFTAQEWTDAVRVDLTNETHPRQNVPAPVATEVYLMEDGEHFLVAFVAHDPEPDKIRAFYRDRDRAWQDDFVGVVLDTFNDERRAFEFFVNPLGAQMDLTQDDVARREDDSWNAIWDAAGEINDSGFVVEMRIPLRQLRFPAGLEKQIWGIDLLRFWPRDVRHRISSNLTDYGVSCYLCLLQKAEGFRDLEQGTNLQIIPTVTSLMNERRANPVNDAWTRNNPEFEGGADLRWGINEDMILNATLNPDFSQVEADNAQLDVNNTFTLQFPERREFFLDGADYFSTFSDLVYTRNISDPDYGAKVTGKSGNHSYGAMLANDTRTGFVIPGNQGSSVATIAHTGSNNMALRYRYDSGRDLTIGALTTVRQADDYQNLLFSTDVNWRFGPADRVSLQLMGSDTEYPLAIQTANKQKPELSDTAYSLRYNHNAENFSFNAGHAKYGEDFRADLGFINRVAYRDAFVNPSYTWRPQESPITAVYLWSNANRSEDQNGNLLTKAVNAGFGGNGPWQSFMETGHSQQQRFFNGQLFDTHNTFMFMQMQPWGGAQFRMNINKGTGVDFANTRLGDIFTFAPGFTLQLGRHLQTQLSYNHQELDVDGGRLYTTDLMDLRLTWQFSIKSFVRVIMVYSDTERDPTLYKFAIDAESRSLATQLLYSYRFNAQTRFFIGYSDSAIDHDRLAGLEATGRAVFAKFSYAWQM